MLPPERRLASLISACQRRLAELEGTRRLLVLTLEPGHEPSARAAQGDLDPQDLVGKAHPAGLALTTVREKGRSVLALDIRQDPAFATCARRAEGRSLLCVAIPGRQGPAGFLYADHPERAGAFPHADLRRIEAFAAEIGPALEDTLHAVRTAPPPGLPRVDHFIPLRAAAVLLLLGGLWAAGGFFLHTRPAPPPPPTRQVARRVPPEVVVATYLASLRAHESKDAYAVLSSRLQRKVSAADFDREVSSWMKSRAWDIERRNPAPAQVTGRRAQVEVLPTPAAQNWRYQLVQETDGGAWKLDHWEGGPLSGV